MDIGTYLWLVPVLPLLGATVNGLRAALNQGPKNKAVTNLFALGSTFLSAVIATVAVIARFGSHEAFEVVYWEWIPSGMGHVGALIANFSVGFGLQIDPPSSSMMSAVCWDTWSWRSASVRSPRRSST